LNSQPLAWQPGDRRQRPNKRSSDGAKKLHSEQQQRAKEVEGARVRFDDGRIRVMEQRASRERERD